MSLAYLVNVFYETGLEALEVRRHELIHDLVSVWTKEIKTIIFFPLYRIVSNCIVLNWIALQRNRCELHRFVSLAATYVSSMYHIVGYASRWVLHRSQLWRCVSLELIGTYFTSRLTSFNPFWFSWLWSFIFCYWTFKATICKCFYFDCLISTVVFIRTNHFRFILHELKKLSCTLLEWNSI